MFNSLRGHSKNKYFLIIYSDTQVDDKDLIYNHFKNTLHEQVPSGGKPFASTIFGSMERRSNDQITYWFLVKLSRKVHWSREQIGSAMTLKNIAWGDQGLENISVGAARVPGSSKSYLSLWQSELESKGETFGDKVV